ncbi:hypothetical protein BV898_00489 [Hypsibius exemplaris]|uniref:PH domain-containing protein n=1 Tax=Hypsibius exemplaris TaxID=2072580 RepID=A0A1W0XDW1_HYPEX|nr:hypothetical protein BV898_00489 [Hypsibius exemplaris]
MSHSHSHAFDTAAAAASATTASSARSLLASGAVAGRQNAVQSASPRKMTCRTPSSASTGSSSSGVSSLSAESSTSSSSSAAAAEWKQSVSIREIYKTGKLSLLVDKKGIFWRHEQGQEPFWCVFCIHEESYPFLELYEDHKSSLTHKPLRIISLIECQHVSPNISLAENKHSFTLTLATELHQFSAATEADMHDWIATLRTRLHDLQGLESDQNTYTRCPLPAKSERLLMTPEPLFVELPPCEPRNLPPPTEVPRAKSPRKSPTPPRPTELAIAVKRNPERRPSPLPSVPAVPSSSSSSFSSQRTTHIEPLASPPACEAPPVPGSMPPPPPVPPRGIRPMRPVPHPLITAHVPPPPPPRSGEQQHVNDDLPSHSALAKPPRPPRKEDFRSGIGDTAVEQQLDEAPLIYLADEPRPAAATTVTVKQKKKEDEGCDVYGTLFQRKVNPHLSQASLSSAPSSSAPTRPPVALATERKKETRSQTASPALSETDSVVSTAVSEPSCDTPSSSSASTLTTSPRSLPRQQLRHTHRTTPVTTSAPSTGASTTASLTATPTAVTAVTASNTGHSSTTLRQQQVERLKQEMCEPSGVKVRVRRADCLSALALVDALGCVWVAGWKQKEHPHFHSLFHLGDQILAINGIYVAKSADVFRVLKDCPESHHTVFNVNRVPRGQVFVLARDHDGQDLGIIREGNTAELRSVLSDGLAALHGLPAKAITCDGSTLCNWVITEINHRPLNWFFKDSEIDDRLRAVGREISILVQPSDLVNAIKKQLRTLRNYKDFIVQ